jgi:hypothetical protein
MPQGQSRVIVNEKYFQKPNKTANIQQQQQPSQANRVPRKPNSHEDIVERSNFTSPDGTSDYLKRSADFLKEKQKRTEEERKAAQPRYRTNHFNRIIHRNPQVGIWVHSKWSHN